MSALSVSNMAEQPVRAPEQNPAVLPKEYEKVVTATGDILYKQTVMLTPKQMSDKRIEKLFACGKCRKDPNLVQKFRIRYVY